MGRLRESVAAADVGTGARVLIPVGMEVTQYRDEPKLYVIVASKRTDLS